MSEFISINDQLPKEGQQVECQGINMPNMPIPNYKATFKKGKFWNDKGIEILFTSAWKPIIKKKTRFYYSVQLGMKI